MSSPRPEARALSFLPPSLRPISILLLLALMAPAGAAATTFAPDPSRCGGRPLALGDADPVVLELRVRGARVRDAILAYEHRGELLLPLGELASAFELALEVDPARGRAAGWVIDESRSLELDLARCRLEVEGIPRDLAGVLLGAAEDDLYAGIDVLESWLPVAFDYQPRAMILDVRSRELLPIEARLERDRLRRRLRRGDTQGTGGTAREEPYRAWSVPFLDVHLENRAVLEDGDAHWRLDSDLAAAGDLLWLSTHLFYGGTTDGTQRLRMRAGRRHPDGGMGGPLNLTEFGFGDISNTPLPLVARSFTGRGVQISSMPLDYSSDLSQVTLEGDLPAGWEVELYRNELLLDFQAVGSDQRYSFVDVPTLGGLNVFRLVFYGPRGEQREEERRIWMTGGMAPAGTARFRITANQHEQDLIELDSRAFRDERRGEPRAVGELEVGLAESVTLAFGGATLPVERKQRHYGTFGLRTTFLGSYAKLDALASHEGGWGAGVGLQTRLADNTLTFSHHHFDAFLSERTREDGGEHLLSQSQGRIYGLVRRGRHPVAYQVSAEHDRLAGGRDRSDLQLRLSTFARLLWITHTLRARLDRGGTIESTSVDGDLLGTSRVGPFTLRGRLGYRIEPAELLNTGVSLDWRPERDYAALVGLTHDFGGRTRASFTLGRRILLFFATASFDVDSAGDLGVRAGLAFGLAPNPRARRLEPLRPAATRRGAISARVFLDRDADGRYGEADAPLAGVGFDVQSRERELTGPEGTAFVGDLSVERRVAVALDPDTLIDPLWVVPEESEEVILRPGVAAQLDFPVLPTGEIDGMIWVEREGVRRSRGGIELQLLDASGAEIQRLRSEVDGFYLVDRIPPGRYQLRVDPGHASRLSLMAPPPRSFEITPDGTILSGQDFVLRPY